MRTNHSEHIARLREEGGMDKELAADLLEIHDATGISLDNWGSARKFVEHHMGATLQENEA